MAKKEVDEMLEKLKKSKKEEPTQPDDDEDEEVQEDVADEEPKENVGGELAILQNNGVFRRELLIRLQDLISVQKIIAQSLIDLRKLLVDKK